jgi:hypothetical protein
MKTKILFIGILFITLIATSCKKDDIEPPTVQKPQNMNELVASQSFDWKTTKDFQFTINGNIDAVVKIVSANGVVYHKGFLKTNSPYKVNLSLPTYEKTVRIIYFGKDIECSLNQLVINQNFNIK